MRAFVNTLVSWGPSGLLVLAILDSMGVPIPAAVDALLMVLSASAPARATLCALLATAGSVAGSMFLFYIARRGGEAYLERQSLSLRARKFRQWFQHYGLVTIFIPAVLPIPLPMKLFVLCAGALGVKPLHFFLTVLLARLPRYLALAYLGSQLGGNATGYLKSHALHLGAIAVALFAVCFAVIRVLDMRRSTRAA